MTLNWWSACTIMVVAALAFIKGADMFHDWTWSKAIRASIAKGVPVDLGGRMPRVKTVAANKEKKGDDDG